MARFPILAALVLAGSASSVDGGEPVTLDNVVDPGPNRLDEPLANTFSLERAVDFLDSAALQWQKEKKCFTCHTNLAYLYARPPISSDAQGHREVRRSAEVLVEQRWPAQGPRWDAEVVATAAALAFNDAASTGELHPATKTALDRMWTLQRADGGWDWLKCDWPPFEYDDHYGVTLAAIAAGSAPSDYAQSDVAQTGLAGIRRYLREHPPENVHHRAMLLWAASYHEGLISQQENHLWIKQLLALQKPDGGWSAATLGDWKRADGTAQDTTTSDGYGTGFVLFVLRTAGISKVDDRIQRGVQWLTANQRESGRWISRSLYKDSKHYLSHAGSAFAVMAWAACR